MTQRHRTKLAESLPLALTHVSHEKARRSDNFLFSVAVEKNQEDQLYRRSD